ncbi:MAG: hypothetical protein ACOX4U_06625 [Anaerovoracaceae bacterium]|jgi:hypothetical protein
MKKKLLYPLIAFTLFTSFICLTACEFSPDNLIHNIKNISLLKSGEIDGQIGKTYKTAWFEFNIESVEKINGYDDYFPEDGHVLYDVVIEEKNISKEPITMGTFDFYMISPSFSEKYFPLDPLDENMMPFEFQLQVDKKVKYHMIYEVPDNATDLMLRYIEIDDENKEGSTFTFKI